jgi:anaerobic ribonucleoside-triphosphate reductase activating protein
VKCEGGFWTSGSKPVDDLVLTQKSLLTTNALKAVPKHVDIGNTPQVRVGSRSMLNVQIAHIVESTQAEGPGNRFSIWFQGCTLRCPGCCNPELFSSRGGIQISVSEILNKIAALGSTIEGISVLGGEPFEQAEALNELVTGTQKLGQSVMVYSGFSLHELKQKKNASVDSALAHIDLLVDGRFEEKLKSTARRWIGSSNQQLHFLSSKYAPTDARFISPNTMELRLVNGKLTVNGWPQLADSLRPK